MKHREKIWQGLHQSFEQGTSQIDYLRQLDATAKDYATMLAALEHTPFGWCPAWKVETHQCQVLWQTLVVSDLADSDSPFDLMLPGAMAAHRRLRAAASNCGSYMAPQRGLPSALA